MVLLAQPPLQFADLSHHISQLRSQHHGLFGADRRQAAVSVELAPTGQLIGIEAITAGHHRDASPRFNVLAHHGALFLDAAAAPSLLAKQFGICPSSPVYF